MATKLTPPDKKQCQAERSNGFNAFSLGGSLEYIRCTNTPSTIATEVLPGADGKKGKMSLCNSCLKELVKRKPGYATFWPIDTEKTK